MNKQVQALVESKLRERARLAALPFDEKVPILEKLRDRALAIASAPLRQARQSSIQHAWLVREETSAPLKGTRDAE